MRFTSWRRRRRNAGARAVCYPHRFRDHPADFTQDLSTDLIVHLPNLPVSPSAVSPEGPEKRSLSQYESGDKENVSDSVYASHSQKRIKPTHRLTALATSNLPNYDMNAYAQPFTYAPQANLSPWREMPPSHLSPYPHSGSEMGYGSDYSRSPNPEADRSYHSNHLAPILTHSQSHSPAESPAFPPTATMQSVANSYFPRNAASYMQQQQVDYLHTHGHPQAYDYGSPYLTDGGWDGQFTSTTQA